MKRAIFLLMLGVGGALLLRSFVMEGIYLKTDSMAPTYPQGAHVFVNKISFLFRSPRRGEIVLFHTPQQPDSKKDLVKRVIAVEGDSLEIREKEIYLNQKLLEEPYVQHLHPDEMYTSDNRPAIKVPSGCVVVMGDNRDVSGDSRDWMDKDGQWSPYVCGSSIKGLVMGVKE